MPLLRDIAAISQGSNVLHNLGGMLFAASFEAVISVQNFSKIAYLTTIYLSSFI